jgi:lipopolysaccharide biosynthesis regulator YciM
MAAIASHCRLLKGILASQLNVRVEVSETVVSPFRLLDFRIDQESNGRFVSNRESASAIETLTGSKMRTLVAAESVHCAMFARQAKWSRNDHFR